MDSASPCRTTWWTSRTGASSGKTDLGDGYTRWDWHIHYPINSYNVSLNIGNYVHFGEKMGDLTLDYYVLPGSLEKAEGPVRAGQADDRGLSRSSSASIHSPRTATS